MPAGIIIPAVSMGCISIWIYQKKYSSKAPVVLGCSKYFLSKIFFTYIITLINEFINMNIQIYKFFYKSIMRLIFGFHTCGARTIPVEGTPFGGRI